MKAVAVFPQGHEVKLIDVPEPRLSSPSQVRVRTLEVGVCGTDKGVTGQYTERGIQGAHGFAAEQFVEDALYLHRVPRELREVAVLTEPLTIAEKALREVAHLRTRMPWGRALPGRALVLGAGPVGLLGAMALMRAGFQTTVYSRSPKPNPKADMAEALGAPYVSSKQHPVEALVKQRGHADMVYEAAGVASAAFEVLRALAPNGVFVFTGVPESEEGQLDEGGLMKQVVLNNQVMLGTVNAAATDFEAALEDLGRFRAKWPGRVERLITARHRPEDYAEVVRGTQGSPIKDVIVFTPR